MINKVVALTALVLVLGLVNLSIADKEKQLSEGALIYLQLAPVDPRSLMQGDYMALEFALARAIQSALPRKAEDSGWRQSLDAADGYVVIALDSDRVAQFVRLYHAGDAALADNEMLLFYRVRNNRVKVATNAFFFQEGSASDYEPAKYGAFRVDSDGQPLLVSLHDEELQKLGE